MFDLILTRSPELFKRARNLAFYFSTFAVITIGSNFGINQFPIISVLLWVVWLLQIIPWLVHLDAPLSTDALTLTRPIDRFELLKSKILFLTIYGILPLVAIYFFKLVGAGLPFTRLPMAFFYNFIWISTVFLASYFIASCTKNTKDYLVILGAASLLIYAINSAESLLGVWPLRAFYLAPTYSIALALERLAVIGEWTVYISFFISLIYGVYSLHFRRNYKVIGLLFFLAATLSVSVAALYVVKVKENVSITAAVPTKNVVINKPQAAFFKGDNESSNYLSFSLPAVSDQTIPYILRFAQLSITDDTGKSVEIPVENRGYLPCIDPEALKVFLNNNGVKVNNFISGPCKLGVNYSIPKELSFRSNVIPKITGKVYGLDLSLRLDYKYLYGEESSGRAPIVAHSRYSSSIAETEFKPILLSDPVENTEFGTPLAVHWYSTPRTYIFVNQAGEARNVVHSMNYGINVGGFIYKGLSTFLKQSLTDFKDEYEAVQTVVHSLDNRNGGVTLYRVSPQVEGRFMANINLTDVPVVMGSKNE